MYVRELLITCVQHNGQLESVGSVRMRDTSQLIMNIHGLEFNENLVKIDWELMK